MKINYVKKVVKGCYSGYGYEIKEVELCCEDIKNDLINNQINMSTWNPYKHINYFLGLVNGNHRKKLKVCPFCEKPIILNKLEDEVYSGDDYYEAEEIKDVWDEFYPYDFKKGQRFENYKYEE
ncbi:hypothetical protein [uncultured Clostridium sp.]|uniref:hypothetical protein n=1 Tax=uncultured Clostridium sp. TaxID=59620 RepID=UPI00321802CA